MTGDEVVTLARTYFGEVSAGTLTEPQVKDLVNAAIADLYNRLPEDALESLRAEDVVSVGTDGQGDIPDGWDRIVDVHEGGSPLVPVTADSVRAIDLSDYNAPAVAVWSAVRPNLWVRPKPGTATDHTVVHIDPPSDVADGSFSSDLTVTAGIPLQWHPAVALMAASLAYAQEEDAGQARLYAELAVAQVAAASGAAREGTTA